MQINIKAFFLILKKNEKKCVIFEILNYIFLLLSSIGCSTVSLAVTRLTVYRQLQVTVEHSMVPLKGNDREVVGIALLCYYYQR